MQNEKITYISAKNKWFNVNLKEIWRYRDLIFLFVKRNITTSYKQTVLGAAWAFLRPLITALVLVLAFGRIL